MDHQQTYWRAGMAAGFAHARPADGSAPRSPEEMVLLWIGLLGALILVPFTWMHLASGRLLLGLVSLAVLLLGMASVAYAWRSRDLRIGGTLFTLVYMGGLLAAVYVGGISLMYWSFPAMASAYFFVPVRWAVAFNVVLMFAMGPAIAPALPSVDLYRVVAALVLTNLIVCLFAGRMIGQRNTLSRLATCDPLTGVGNRHALEMRLREMVALSDRRGDPVSMLLIDVDRFKSINDSLGHAHGDRILAGVAEAISSRIRLSDGLFRFGGDEFVLLLNDTTLDDAGRFAEQLRGLIECSARQLGHPVTISVGTAQRLPGESSEAWLRRADAALYEAKNGGRNNACVA